MAWYRDVLKADWATPAAVKAQFGTASVLKDGFKFRMEQQGLKPKDLESGARDALTHPS